MFRHFIRWNLIPRYFSFSSLLSSVSCVDYILIYAFYRKEVSSTCLCSPNILLFPSFPRLLRLPQLLFFCLDNDRLVLMSLQTPIPRKIGGGRQRSGWFSLRKISFQFFLLLLSPDKKETITTVERSSSSLSCNCLIHCL
jgi:hypothetical protein